MTKIPYASEIKRFAETIQPVFQLLNWEWDNYSDGVKSVPSVNDIEDVLTSLVQRLIEQEATMIGTGGLFAERDDDLIRIGLTIHADTLPKKD